MGHKIPWKGDTSAFAKDEICFIVDSDGELVAEVSGDTKNDAASKRHLIITAVNVMPEVKWLLTAIAYGKIRGYPDLAHYEKRCNILLEKLEGIDVN